MIHHLKIKDSFFEDIYYGKKRFEVRFNDRDYKIGDIIAFMTEDGKKYRPCDDFEITYIHSGLGLKDGYVVLQLNEDV